MGSEVLPTPGVIEYQQPSVPLAQFVEH